MCVAWQTPKTDWKVTYDSNGQYQGDYFEATDYQRIKGNILVLKEIGERVFSSISIPELPDVTVQSFGFASYFDALERSLDAILAATLNPGIPPTKTWGGNSAAPLYSDLNRIENATLVLYKVFIETERLVPKLSFEMGGSEF